MMGAFILILLMIAAFILSFLITSGLIWIICWAFSFIFSWKLAIGVYAALLLLSSVFKVSHINSEK